MIRMRMRKQNELHIHFVVICRADYLPGISAGIERCPCAYRRIPDKVGVNSHALIIAVELREAIERFDFVWMPFAVRNFTKGPTLQAKNRRNAHERRFVEIAVAQVTDYLRTDTGSFGQFRI